MIFIDDMLHAVIESYAIHWDNLIGVSGLYEDVVNQIVEAPFVKYYFDTHLPYYTERDERIQILQIGLVVSTFYLGHNYIHTLMKTSVMSTVEATILVYSQLNTSVTHKGNDAQDSNIATIIGAYVNTHAFSSYPSNPVQGKDIVVNKLALTPDWVSYFNKQYDAHAGSIQPHIH